MQKTKKCDWHTSTGCKAPTREACPKKRLPREATIFCYKVKMVDAV